MNGHVGIAKYITTTHNEVSLPLQQMYHARRFIIILPIKMHFGAL